MLTKTNTLARVLGVGIVSSAMSLAAGCGASDDLDLSQLALVSEDAPADGTSSALLWARPSPSEIYCVRAPCPAYMMAEVNLANRQLTYAIDWRALKLPTEQQTALSEDASKMLLYGRYAIAKAFGEKVQVFQVTRANRRVSEQSTDTPDSDRYYSVKAGDPSCQQMPCDTLNAMLLNRPEPEHWNGVNLSRLGLTPAAQQQLISEFLAGTAFPSAREITALPVVLTAAFRPYNAKPLP